MDLDDQLGIRLEEPGFLFRYQALLVGTETAVAIGGEEPFEFSWRDGKGWPQLKLYGQRLCYRFGTEVKEVETNWLALPLEPRQGSLAVPGEGRVVELKGEGVSKSWKSIYGGPGQTTLTVAPLAYFAGLTRPLGPRSRLSGLATLVAR